MGRKQGTSVMLLALYAMLIAALLVLVVAGARLYGSAVEGQNRRSDQRRAASFIQSQAAACEGGTVTLGQGPEGDMLVLPDSGGEYETRIYLYEGALRSEFSAVGAPLNPEISERICSLTDFAATDADGLLLVLADGREVITANRGGGHND